MNEPTEQKYRCAICEGDHVTTFCPDALDDDSDDLIIADDWYQDYEIYDPDSGVDG